MAGCRAKLRNRNGASMIIAMVVFLICAILSMTVVNGALSSVHSMAMQQKEEQAYLSVTSAARLFCKLAETGDAGVVTETKTDINKKRTIVNDDETTETYYELQEGPPVPSNLSFVHSVIWQMINKAKSSTDPDTPVKCTLHIIPPEIETPDAKTLKSVLVSLTVDPADYSLKADFRVLSNESDSYHLIYRTTVHFTCRYWGPDVPGYEPQRISDEPDEGDQTIIYRKNITCKTDRVERGRWTAGTV